MVQSKRSLQSSGVSERKQLMLYRAHCSTENYLTKVSTEWSGVCSDTLSNGLRLAEILQNYDLYISTFEEVAMTLVQKHLVDLRQQVKKIRLLKILDIQEALL